MTRAGEDLLGVPSIPFIRASRLSWGALPVRAVPDINERNAMARPDKAAAVAEIKQSLSPRTPPC